VAYLSIVNDDFSGGITDHIDLGITNKYEELRNIIVARDGDAISRQGSEILDSSVNRILSNAPVRNMFEFDSNYFMSSDRQIFRITGTPLTQSLLTGPTGNRAFTAGISTTVFDSSEWQNHIYMTNDEYAKPIKIFKDNTGTWQTRTAGLPLVDQTALAFSLGGGAGHTYLYAFMYYYEYKVGSVTYINEGPVGLFQTVTTNAVIDAGNPNVITGIPVLANGVSTNYDTVNIKIRVFRTEDVQTAFYYVGEVTNGTVTLTDNIPDATLVNNDILYINGGLLDNDEPPLSKYIINVEGKMLYANIQEGTPSENKEFRLRQSKQNNPDSCPASMYKDFAKNITGIGSIRNIPIVFAKDSCWRLDGFFGDDGSGTITAISISDTIGCVSNNSIIKTDQGLLLATNKGWGICDGYDIKIISEDLLERYSKTITDSTITKQIYGAYDKVQNLAYWTTRLDERNDYCDSLFVLHLYHGIKRSSCYTTWDNPRYFYPTSIMVDESGRLIRGDNYGYLFKHDSSYRNDPKIDLDIADPNDWSKVNIPYEIVSSALYTDSKEQEKYGAKIITRCKNVSNLSLQIEMANNGYKNWKKLEEIRRRDQMPWYKPYVSWETDPLNYNWLNTEDIIETRQVPGLGSIRYYTKQVRFTPSTTLIEKSDIIGTATIDGTLANPTVTLDDPTFKWPLYCDDYYIRTEADDYTEEFLILERTSDLVIKVVDPFNHLATALNQKWEMVGKPKDELLQLKSYTQLYTLCGNTYKGYQTGDAGKNE
jgi:hypothetical protein